MVIVQLSNGRRVANFSSNHPFKYTDGTVLPAVSAELSKHLEVVVTEEQVTMHGDVQLYFCLSDAIRLEMQAWCLAHDSNEVDCVICPLMMIQAIAAEKGEQWLVNSPFRAIRIEDRIMRLASIDKQCLAKGQC